MAPLLLLIDDAPEIALIVRLLARRSGQEAVFAIDGDSALAALRALPRLPDLMLVDLNLPDEGGIEVHRRLRRELPAGTHVPSALFTQGASSAQLADALDAGMDFLVGKDLLSKPTEWKLRIGEVLDRAARPPVVEPVARIDAAVLRDAVERVLRHPALTRLGEPVVEALCRGAGRLAGGNPSFPQENVDVPPASVTLLQEFELSKSSRPAYVAHLVACLSHRAECVLGRAASEPLRTILTTALADSVR